MSDERYIKLLTEINKYGLDKGCAVEVMAVHNATGQTVKQLCGMHEKEVLQQLIEGYLFQKEQRSKLEAENAALRERLGKWTVDNEIVMEPRVKDGKIYYVISRKERRIVTHYICTELTPEAAEARLIELQGGEK